MNTIDPSAFCWGLTHLDEDPAEDLAEVAANAIFSCNGCNTLKLQGSLQQGLVDATTATANGETLIVLAVRIDKPQAFEDLAHDFPEHRAQEFNLQDQNGDTLLHHLARHRAHMDFAPGFQAPWRRVILGFLDVFSSKLDGGIRNNEEETALDLAHRLGKSRLAGVLKAYGVKVTAS
jgi:ankyrin repeat protein